MVNLASLASPTTARVAGQRQSSLCASRLERRATGLCWGRPSRVEDADTSGLPVSSFDFLREDVWISPIRQFVTIKNRNVFFAETIKSVFVNVGDGAGARRTGADYCRCRKYFSEILLCPLTQLGGGCAEERFNLCVRSVRFAQETFSNGKPD